MTPRRLASRSMAREPTRPAMLTSLAATQAPVAATSASTRTSPASRVSRSSNDRKKGKSSRIVPSVTAATTRRWPAAARVTDSTVDGPPADAAQAEGGDGRRAVVEREVAADDRHVVEAGGVAHALQGQAGDVGRRHHRVDDGQRHRPHGGQVVDVGQHRRHPRPVRVVGHEAGGDGLAAHHQVAAHQGPVVARPGQPVGRRRRPLPPWRWAPCCAARDRPGRAAASASISCTKVDTSLP